jgi:6,7-dimethyl-8-ribityllumazine synthase
MTKILIVEARFYAGISDALLAGATAVLKAAGVEYDTVSVPGALEIPGAIAMANASGHAAGAAYDGYVALGCVIRAVSWI